MSRELLQQCLDLITELDKDGVVCELGLILELRNALGVPDKLKMKAELAKPEQEAYGYAKRLAEFIWEKHYKKESPDWTPLPDVLGVLTQIDNMTCGLELAKPEMPTKIFGPNLEQILNAAGFYRREWVGLTDDEIKEVLDLNVAPWSLSGVALQHVMDDARALEAKLKEKNGG
jgi:hypothetical protein